MEGAVDTIAQSPKKKRGSKPIQPQASERYGKRESSRWEERY